MEEFQFQFETHKPHDVVSMSNREAFPTIAWKSRLSPCLNRMISCWVRSTVCFLDIPEAGFTWHTLVEIYDEKRGWICMVARHFQCHVAAPRGCPHPIHGSLYGVSHGTPSRFGRGGRCRRSSSISPRPWYTIGLAKVVLLILRPRGVTRYISGYYILFWNIDFPLKWILFLLFFLQFLFYGFFIIKF